MATRRNEIPEDLMIEILQRLPVKSILRFRCVCKSWSSLLKSPSFVNNHLNMTRNSNSNNTGGTLLVSHYNTSVGKRLFSFFSAETLLDPSINGKHIQFPEEYERFVNPNMIVIGSCNGLCCLKVCNKGENENTLLWNPATQEVKVVPYSDVPKPRDCWIPSTQYGFGFDPKTNDYKVLRLRTVHCFSGEKIKQIELYGLRTDSWRQLHVVDDIIFPRLEEHKSSLNVYMNGRYHWWVVNTETDSILSFDMGDEEFRTMPFPDLFNEYDINGYRGNIAVLNESMMTSIVFPYDQKKCYGIWVMHEYGVKESWTKEYVIGPTYRVERPLAFWKNNGGLFFNDISGQLVLYNSTDQEAKHVQITGADGCFSKKHLRVLNYVESLVSLKGRPELEEHIARVDDMA